jgi:hypothetical protein
MKATIILTTQTGTVISCGHIFYVTHTEWNGGKLTGPMIDVEKYSKEDAISYLKSKAK